MHFHINTITTSPLIVAFFTIVITIIILGMTTGSGRKFFAIIGGFSTIILGKYGFLSFKILRPFTIPTLSADSFDKMQKRTKKQLNRVSYDDIEDQLKTGDIVLIAGSNSEHRLLVAKWSAGTCFSHVGIIVKYGENLKLFEATADFTTVFTPLKNRLEYYDSDLIAIRRLNKPLSEFQIDKLFEFVYETVGKEHDQHHMEGIKEMFRAALDIRIPFTKRDLVTNKKDLTSLFCSETVAEALMRMGLLASSPSDPPSNEYLPGDMTNFHSWNSVELQNFKNLGGDFRYEDELFLEPIIPNEN